MDETKRISNRMYAIRFIIIILVIMAHVNRSTITQYDDFLFKVYGILCRIAVPIFFLISGYYYREYSSIKSFFKKKTNTLIIPWIIAGVITYSIHSLKIKSFSFINLLLWIVGYETFFYYLSVYFLFQLFYKFIRKSDIILIISVVINIVLLFVEQNNLITYNIITPLLNPFNWCGFFSIGIFLSKYNVLNNINNSCFGLIISALSSIIIFIFWFCNWQINRFNIFVFLFSISMFFFLFFITKYLINKKMIEIGKYTFFIYIYHMQIVQFICFKLPNNYLINFLNPFIGMIIMIVLIFIFEKIYMKYDIKFTKILGLNFTK